eukprot:201516-Amphidinium_carterae.1
MSSCAPHSMKDQRQVWSVRGNNLALGICLLLHMNDAVMTGCFWKRARWHLLRLQWCSWRTGA